MTAGLVIAILIVLVLLLTGAFGPGLLFSLKFGGWILVGIIPIVLVWMAIARLSHPVTEWVNKRSAMSNLRYPIRKCRALGYETTELEAELMKLTEDLGQARIREERRRMGV